MGCLNPNLALPTPVVGRPSTSTVNPAPTLLSAAPTASLLPLLPDTASTITTAVTDSVTDSVLGKLAAGLQVLALAPRPSGVAIYPDGKALPVPTVAAPAVQPPTATTPAAAQHPGRVTTVPAAASTSTAATPAAPAVLPESTTTSSAVPTTSPTIVAVSTALSTSTAASSVVTAPDQVQVQLRHRVVVLVLLSLFLLVQICRVART